MTLCSGNIYYKAMYTFVTACRRKKKKVPQTKPLCSDEFSKILVENTQWAFMDEFFFKIIYGPPIKYI